MEYISAVIIGKLIEAHMENDNCKFLSYANLIEDAYKQAGEELKSRIVRTGIEKTYKNNEKIVLNAGEKQNIPIYVKSCCQTALAKMKLVPVREMEHFGIFGMFIAVLYDIEEQLKPFPMYSMVEILGKECIFYLGEDKELGQRVLIQRDCTDYEFWFGSSR